MTARALDMACRSTQLQLSVVKIIWRKWRMKKISVDFEEEEVECAYCWVGEGEERCGASGQENQTSHSAFPISFGIIGQYYLLLHFFFFSCEITWQGCLPPREMSHGGVGWEHLSVPYAAPYWEREIQREAEWAQTHQGHHSLAAPLLSQPGAVPWTRSIPSIFRLVWEFGSAPGKVLLVAHQLLFLQLLWAVAIHLLNIPDLFQVPNF